MKHLYYPFICKWTLRLLPHLRYFEKCHNEYECRRLFSILISVPLDKYPSDVRLLDDMVVLFLIFWEASVRFSVVVVPACILINRPAMHKGCLFSIPCQHLTSLMSSLIAFLTSVRWYLTMVLLHIPCCLVMLGTFSCTCWSFVYLFLKTAWIGRNWIVPSYTFNWVGFCCCCCYWDVWVLICFELVLVKVTQSCLTLCNSINCTVHGILQARILEWVAFPFSRGSSQPRDWTQVSHIVTNPLLDTWVVGIFSHSIGCIFILLFPLLCQSFMLAIIKSFPDLPLRVSPSWFLSWQYITSTIIYFFFKPIYFTNIIIK